MKKLAALFVSLCMLFSCAAFAEEEVIVNIEDLYEGVWVPFEDDGFEIYLPSEWLIVELTEEEIAQSGIYFMVASEDGAYTASVAWQALEAEVDLAGLEASLAAGYPGAQIIATGNIESVCFADGENDMLGFALLDQEDLGMYLFCFTPASDADMQLLATMIMTSIRPIEVAAE